MINILQHYVKHSKIAAYIVLDRDHPYLVVESVYLIIVIIINRLLWHQYPRKIRDQWRNKTKGLGILVTMYNAKSCQPMDGGAKKLRRIGHFEKIGFQITAK